MYIQNQATAGLYLYTPYRPNAAALANLYGTGDGCSSYGNRNFWRMFTDWFGSTSVPAQVDVRTNTIPLVYARDGVGDLWVYPGTGAGTWRARVRVGVRVGGDAPRHRRGRPDRATDTATCSRSTRAARCGSIPRTGWAGSAGRVHLGNGYGSVTALVSAGDFNSDGTPDFFTRDARGDLQFFAGNGTGQFAPPKRVGIGWGGMTALVGGIDFDGDGRSDVLARTGNGELRLYRGDGRTGWSGVRVVGIGWSGMSAIMTPGDFDGDGADDVIARDSSGRLWLYPGNGTGGWKPKRVIGVGWGGFATARRPGQPSRRGRSPRSAAWATSRTKAHPTCSPDRATARSGSIARTVPAVGVPEARWPRAGAASRRSSARATSIATADGTCFVRDGGGILWRYPANGAGGFGTRVQIGGGLERVHRDRRRFDFTGDRNLDVLARNTEGELWIYRGDGRGRLSSRVRRRQQLADDALDPHAR